MIEKVRCRYCNGAGWFPDARPKNEKPQPDVMCGQCNGHGHVFREQAMGAKAPVVMQGQQQLGDAT